MLQIIALYLIIQACTGQPICEEPSTELYTNNDLNRFSACHQINGSLILGKRTCTIPCTITDFSSLNNVQSITGSFIIQCCNTMTTLPSPASLTKVGGTFQIYYNSNLRSIDGLILATVGNVDISQNRLLQTIAGFQQLVHISGFISINYNPSLTSITGFSKLASIRGSQLINGHALSVLYNGALTDISGFKSLSTIEYGTVNIQGNTQLCYAGYPKWSYGSYGLRYSTGDKGIDWRTKLSLTYNWQFTWGSDNGIPTLNIQNNGNQTTCVSATCHSSCTSGAGCLGPNEPDLCGKCYQTSSINSCDELSPPDTQSQTCMILWPPTELPFSAVFGLVVGLGGILIILIVIGILVVVYKVRKRFSDENKGSYHVQSTVETGDYESDSSYLYAQPNKAKKTTESAAEIELKATVSGYAPVEAKYKKRETEQSKSPGFRESRGNEEWSTEEGEEQTDEGEEYEFPSKKIQLIKEIGKGEFGKVYEALASGILPGEKSTQIVVKQCHSYASDEELGKFLEPAEAMRHLKHENVLSLLGISVDGNNMMILLEYCMHGNLKTYLIKNRYRMNVMKRDGRVLQMIIEAGKGLHYLHTMGIAHNDVSARNCLVSADNRIKVGDYGISRKLFRADYYTRTPGQTAWPVRWMAPEVILDKGNGVLDSLSENEESNIWSFGILMWELCTFCEQPYSTMTDEEVIEQLNNNKHCNLKNPVPAPDPLKSLFPIMKKCWKDSEQRPPLSNILTQLQNVRVDNSGSESSGGQKRATIGYKVSVGNGLTTDGGNTNKTRPQSEQITNSSDKTMTSFQAKKARRESREPLLKRLSVENETEREQKTNKETKMKTEKPVKSIIATSPTEAEKSSKKTSTKSEKRKETKKKTAPPPAPKPKPKAEENSDIDDMDDIFYPSGPPPINDIPLEQETKPQVTSNRLSKDSWDSDEEQTKPAAPLPPTNPPAHQIRQSWDSFDDDDDEETGIAPLPPTDPPPPQNRQSKESSWDSFDDEETDYPVGPPLPPAQFSQEEEDDDDDDMSMLPIPPDDPTTNDWEESEPVSPIKLTEAKPQSISITDTSQTVLIQDDNEQDDDDDDVNIQPVKLDTLGTRTVDDVPPIKQDKAKAKDKKKDKEKKKETEKQKKKKKSEPAEENDILDYAW